MKIVNLESHRIKKQESYENIKQALQFLYEEAIRNNCVDLAVILLETIEFCSALQQGKITFPDTKSSDALHCINFLKAFIEADDDIKKDVFILLDAEKSFLS